MQAPARTTWSLTAVSLPERGGLSTLYKVRRTTNYGFGDRSFSSSGPCLWNTLPKDIRQALVIYTNFKQLLKTSLLRWSRRTVTFWFVAPFRTFTYLLTYLLTYFVIRSNGARQTHGYYRTLMENWEQPSRIHSDFWPWMSHFKVTSVKTPSSSIHGYS